MAVDSQQNPQANSDLLLIPAARWESLSHAQQQSSFSSRPLLEGLHLHKTTIRM